jgi:hypothetical protein
VSPCQRGLWYSWGFFLRRLLVLLPWPPSSLFLMLPSSESYGLKRLCDRHLNGMGEGEDSFEGVDAGWWVLPCPVSCR